MMQGMFVLMTGVPGSGKSTIAHSLETSITPIVRIGFGELIHEIKQQHGVNEDYEKLRATPVKSIPINYVSLAEELLLTRVNSLRFETNILLDSHAVVNDHFGFRIAPEISDFRRVDLNAVIVIHAPFNLVEQRIRTEPKGRNLVSKQIFDQHQALQDTVAIGFSLAAKCPLFVVETNNSLDRTIQILLEIFESIGMSFQKN